MGLRNGELLNAKCPGRCGPSDIDHVLHNMSVTPEHIMFLEYKKAGRGLDAGQRYLFNALRGDWVERNNGRLLSVRYHVMGLHDPKADGKLDAVVDWVWPPIGGVHGPQIAAAAAR
jgi:hypothetical protein